MDIMSSAVFAIALGAMATAVRPHAFTLRGFAPFGVKQGNQAVQGTGVSTFGYVPCTPCLSTATSGLSTALVDRTRTTSDVVSHLGRPLR